ncbi:ShlB/FhaC/HecB family hemolysin secretion/activation protein [Burkholderia pseudomallei]|uniref:ShlB/FhaC/HecB family hemolysin secretion/activation protein n=1 Tax=Burkholderia pseudomallei TaxID=28450 RepID=UPI000F148695|nr:ShlB/FhaC/HecB family hemolysin secretion/activation protein [Burkholderia pseudomallei]CAJ3071439.1 hemolysin activation/secretion protein-like protein [Burkholderia pseudomallei]VCK72921.1 hemolysin activation/secretion protein-like protein [Burkholderia pseudomallei]VCK79953.1 hemolysin activation/secretion protein-like protein [Burkholderia pseudomallei]VCK80068.1 hemolysin activation/secretion protein-like protein [Burkholderia pseudomallei]VCK80824.1 hemolysin activation/secretion pro
MSHTPFARRSRAQTPSRIDCLRKRPLARAVAWAVLAALMAPSLPVFAAESVLSAPSAKADANATNAQAATAAAAGGPVFSDGNGADGVADAAAVFSVQLLGWRVESNDTKLLDAATGQWGAQEAKALSVDANGRAEAQAFAVALQARALRAGFVSVHTIADPTVGVIRLSLLPVHVTQSGRNNYIRYFSGLDGKSVSTHQLEADTRLAQEAAAINGDHVAIALSNPTSSGADTSGNSASVAGTDAGAAMPLTINSAAAEQSKTYGGSLAFSTYGQRYSSRDTLTESGYARVADGLQADLSVTEGLPGLPPRGNDSSGGNFDAISAGLRDVTPWGIGSIRYSHTDYKQGGPDFRDFNINGTIDRVDTQFERPLSQNLSVFFGLSALTQRQSIGAADLDDRQNLLFAQAGVNYQGAVGVSARVMQGLAGADNYNLAPLAGPFDSHFTAFAIDASKSFQLAPRWSLDLAASAQAGSQGTPSAMQFYLGGIGRGRAFTTGNLAGADGAAASATVNYAVLPNWTIYGGLDGGFVKPAGVSTQNETSVFLGVKTAHAIRIGHTGASASLDVGVAQPLSKPAGESGGPTIGVFATIGF